MKTRSIYTSVLLSLCVLTKSFGAEDEPDPKRALWQADLGETSKLSLAVDHIVSVSMHPYLLNGETLITEVTVDTTGNNTIRFYYIHPDEDKADITNPESVVKSARKRLRQQGSQPAAENTIPSLKFPEGAYAHTVEYQVGTFEELEKLHQSLVSVWERSSKKRTTYSSSSSSSK